MSNHLALSLLPATISSTTGAAYAAGMNHNIGALANSIANLTISDDVLTLMSDYRNVGTTYTLPIAANLALATGGVEWAIDDGKMFKGLSRNNKKHKKCMGNDTMTAENRKLCNRINKVQRDNKASEAKKLARLEKIAGMAIQDILN